MYVCIQVETRFPGQKNHTSCVNPNTIVEGSSVRKLPSDGRWLWLAFTFTPSCQTHHHVNSKHVTSRLKTLWGTKPCFFSGNVAPGVAEVGSLFPRFRYLGKLSTESAQDCSESSICTSTCYKNSILETLLEKEVGKMCTTL